MNLFKAPQKLPDDKRVKVFLAGSIEQGKAVDWQDKITSELKDFDIDIFNPRREEWDASWEESIKNHQFKEQVSWELEAMEKSDLILMYFDPKTKSPITLLELGIYATTSKLLVCCEEGFWRKGNVDIVAERYDIQSVDNWNDFVSQSKNEIADLVEFVKSGKDFSEG